MCRPIRLVIADNDSDFFNGLKAFFDEQADIKVVEIARDGQGAVNACSVSLPDLVLMDLRLPVLDSINAVRTIVAQNEWIKIIVTSSIPNDGYAIEAVKAGAYGYIDKSDLADYSIFANTIRQVAKGECVLNPALASSILEEFHRLGEYDLKE